MKNFLLAAFAAALLIIVNFTACKTDHSKQQANATADQTAQADANTAYICPMNCEDGKLYDQPGKCPVCNMNLEPTQRTDASAEPHFFIDLKTTPAMPDAGKPGMLSLTPQKHGAENTPVALDLVHEKKMHLIVVSDDLSWFDHIHPEYQASGSYDIKLLGSNDKFTNGRGATEMRFDNGGRYWAFVDYKPSGGKNQVDKIELNVAGKPAPSKTYDKAKMTASAGGYNLTMEAGHTGGDLRSGEQVHLPVSITKNGKPVDPATFENYLGEKSHLVLVEKDSKTFVHTHPSVSNGKLDIHTMFEKPGTYRGWLQFQTQGVVNTADFVINVVQGSGNTGEHNHDAHDGHQH
ncbi:MAG: hypothetical protein IT270_21670 [Saprospiraceae bacterium]|nr:hypothetical protein [Saprospiraceae bacterium]